jgi:hypothetical protein
MGNEVFVYLEIYSVYLKIYEYGKVVQGVRFPDDTDIGTSCPDIGGWQGSRCSTVIPCCTGTYWYQYVLICPILSRCTGFQMLVMIPDEVIVFSPSNLNSEKQLT